MRSMKLAFKALALVALLAILGLSTLSFATEPGRLQTQIVLTPTSPDGSTFDVYVLAFEPATSSSGTQVSERVRQVYQRCRDLHLSDANAVTQCIAETSYQNIQNTRGYQFTLLPVQDAHISFSYYNSASGGHDPVPGCADLIARDPRQSTSLNPRTAAPGTSTTYYVAQCRIDPAFLHNRARVSLQVDFTPGVGQTINGKSLMRATETYEINNARVSGTTDYTNSINDALAAFMGGRTSGSSGVQTLTSPGAAVCFGGFILLGLLLASMYFSGKSPISLLDITTPRLPTSKPLSASGQIVTPFGYSELTKGVNAKIGKGIIALGLTRTRLESNLNIDQRRRLSALNGVLEGARPPPEAATGTVDIPQQRDLARSLVTAGLTLESHGLSISQERLMRLARTLPYHYTADDQAVVAQIFRGLENSGRRDLYVMVQMLRDQFQSYQAIGTLAVLTGHPGVAVRNRFQVGVMKNVNRFFGNYTGVNSAIAPVIGSTIRSGRAMKDMSKTMVTAAPTLMRGVVKGSMELIAGADALDRLKAASNRSVLAGWAYSQLSKHPSSMEIGQMSPMHERMGFQYRQLRDEVARDQMRFVIRQMYRKMGMTFDIGEAEWVEMGYKDRDILDRCKYKRTAQMEAMEREINGILGNNKLSGQEKLDRLEAVAVKHILGSEIHRTYEEHKSERVAILRNALALGQADFSPNSYFTFRTGFENATNTSIEHESAEYREWRMSSDPDKRMQKGYDEAVGRFDHIRLVTLYSFLQGRAVMAEEQRAVQLAGHPDPNYNDYVCHVGTRKLGGSQVFEHFVLRSRIWDAENNNGVAGAENYIAKDSAVGAEECLKRAWLDNMNRTVSLAPTKVRVDGSKGINILGISQLPEHMQNSHELSAMEARATEYMKGSFTEKGWKDFMSSGRDQSKSLMSQMTEYLQGGSTVRQQSRDPKTGLMAWWGDPGELPVPEGSTTLDMKRHWRVGLEAKEAFAIGQWVNYRFTKSYEAPYDADVERELNDTPGQERWSDAERERRTQELFVRKTLIHDYQNRFNSQFSQNAYGVTAESVKFYTGSVVGCLERLIEEGKLKIEFPKEGNPKYPGMKNMDDVLNALRNLNIGARDGEPLDLKGQTRLLKPDKAHLQLLADLMSEATTELHADLRKLGSTKSLSTDELRKFRDMMLKGEIELPPMDLEDAAASKAGKQTTKEFLAHADLSDAKSADRMRDLVDMARTRTGFEEIMGRKVTYEDIATSKRPYVMLQEGGFTFYHKGMMLSDGDRIMSGQSVMKDHHGQFRPFIADDVTIRFEGRADLEEEFARARSSRDPLEWRNCLTKVREWAGMGEHEIANTRHPMNEEQFERRKVFAAVLWLQSQSTYDYESFWHNSGVEVVGKRNVAPVAPSVLRMFGSDGSSVSWFTKPTRDMIMSLGDYFAAIAMQGGPTSMGKGRMSLLDASYNITPQTEILRQNSWRLAAGVMSGEWTKGMSVEEAEAYHRAAGTHFKFHQDWDYSIDRSFRISGSHGTTATSHTGFIMGPMKNYSRLENVGASMTDLEYRIASASPSLVYHSLAHRLVAPLVDAFAGAQRSMQGQANKWTQRANPLGVWDLTSPRIYEAMESLTMNPSSLKHHQLAGKDFRAGLSQTPQDFFTLKSGVYANLRTGEANPAASYYDYRYTLQLDAPMAEYMRRNRDATYLFDKKVMEAAWTNTTRRTVAAEALQMRRQHELMNFGILQNPLFGWTGAIAMLYHAPFLPPSMSPRDMLTNAITRHRQGRSSSYSDTLENTWQSTKTTVTRMFSPGLRDRTSYCRCGGSGYRGGRCRHCSARV